MSHDRAPKRPDPRPPRHAGRCPVCGHSSRGQDRDKNWITCRRCGHFRKAKGPDR